MNNYGGGMPSADGISAAFPHTILEKINGTPSRIDVDNAQENQIEMLNRELPQEEAERTVMQGWSYPQHDT